MIIHGDSLHELKKLADDSIDFVCTDPPYGYNFMGKDWDKAVPSVEIWQECLRVLKPGAFCCVMSAPRSDVQNAMISRLMEVGFRLDFTPIYWTYASGFPKAGNIGKLVDKRLGAEREIVGERIRVDGKAPGKAGGIWSEDNKLPTTVTVASSRQAKALDGSYAGFQPKPAIEIIITARKPLSISQELTIITSYVIEVLSCLNVSIVASSSSLHQIVKDSIVPRLATGNTSEEVITLAGRVAELSGQMAMLRSTLATITHDPFMSWNIVTLWQSILVDLLKHMSMYTTETTSALITDLKTLSYLLSTSIPENTTLDAGMTVSGFSLNVDTVESVLRSVLTKCSPCPTTAQKTVGKPIEPSKASISALSVVQLSSQTTPSGSSVEKPATTHPEVSVIIVAMKPLSEKTYVDQALKNGKGISWLDDGRIPTEQVVGARASNKDGITRRTLDFAMKEFEGNPQSGRFPANLLVSDDVLNDGNNSRSAGVYNRGEAKTGGYGADFGKGLREVQQYSDSGSYSRYFDLDRWAQTLPFLIVPKAGKGEKNKGLGHLEPQPTANEFAIKEGRGRLTERPETKHSNHHPTVKPLKLMSYLITLFTRKGDIVLDPFVGSGTTCVAAEMLERESIGIEREAEYVEIAQARLENNNYQRSLL